MLISCLFMHKMMNCKMRNSHQYSKITSIHLQAFTSNREMILFSVIHTIIAQQIVIPHSVPLIMQNFAVNHAKLLVGIMTSLIMQKYIFF